uniref:C2H2-type domain-containing protein n=1 Tax=Echinococcus granulosus TaxID=6210 RepID=A0A068X4G4_ECHGR|nr:hypothetical protein EgrG_001155800 [Echinococcus granulosus]
MHTYECILCSASLRGATLYRVHVFQVHQVRPRGRCPICLTYRDTAGLTLLHQRASNHNTCFLCLTPFGQFDFLLLHFIVVHIFQKVGESELRLYCPECYTDYSTWDEMQDHIRSQHIYMWLGLFAKICKSALHFSLPCRINLPRTDMYPTRILTHNKARAFPSPFVLSIPGIAARVDGLPLTFLYAYKTILLT